MIRNGNSQIDHLVWGTDVLADEIVRFEALTGIRPAVGGRHLELGTHNALLSLGPDVYLELMAPDPVSEGTSGVRRTLEAMPRPGLFTFAVASRQLEEIEAKARKLRIATSGIYLVERAKPDGTVLKWRLLVPTAEAFGPLVPFFIDWGDAPHPSAATPAGCVLRSLLVNHPRSAELSALYREFKLDLNVGTGNAMLRAELDTPKGLFVLD